MIQSQKYSLQLFPHSSGRAAAIYVRVQSCGQHTFTSALRCGELDVQFMHCVEQAFYEGWNFNSGNYLFTTDTK